MFPFGNPVGIFVAAQTAVQQAMWFEAKSGYVPNNLLFLSLVSIHSPGDHGAIFDCLGGFDVITVIVLSKPTFIVEFRFIFIHSFAFEPNIPSPSIH